MASSPRSWRSPTPNVAFDCQPTPSGTDEQLTAFGRVLSGEANDDDTWKRLWATIWPLYFHAYDEAEAARAHAGTHYGADAWNPSAALLGAFDVLDELPPATVPTLAIAGRHDFITPPEPDAIRLQALLPNAELAVFESSGHHPFIEEAEAFFARLRRFRDSLG